jgi:hypothetical protein
MQQKILNILEGKKFKIFAHAESLDEARYHAVSILQASHRHDVSEAIDYYHNTLIESIKQDILRSALLYREKSYSMLKGVKQ